jgi:hypothetical protein
MHVVINVGLKEARPIKNKQDKAIGYKASTLLNK